jgi:hypothetical protein
MAGTRKSAVAKKTAGPKTAKSSAQSEPVVAKKPTAPKSTKPVLAKKPAPKSTKKEEDEEATAVFDADALQEALDAAAKKNSGMLSVEELRDILASFLMKGARDEKGKTLSKKFVSELVEVLLVEIVMGSEDDDDGGEDGELRRSGRENSKRG